MVDWERIIDPLLLPFDSCPFWIQVRGLKEQFFTREVAGKVGNDFQACDRIKLRIDKQEEGEVTEESLLAGRGGIQPLNQELEVSSGGVSPPLGFMQPHGQVVTGARLLVEIGANETNGDPQSKNLNPKVFGLPENGPDMGFYHKEGLEVSYSQDGMVEAAKQPSESNEYSNFELSGFKPLRAVRSLAGLVNSKKHSLVFLIETKLWKNEWENIKCKVKRYNLLEVEANDRKGGISRSQLSPIPLIILKH
ncbi:hypothetical protein LIER_16489 [Lithospermum erythrorhizon]|uniref:DUF4283 domain-containing protein n=1 Tax=Lithospermum erythrorhizon TaxID=34254 RepID=A0AAV3QAY0_LITER